MAEASKLTSRVDPPNGIYPARVDEKGRLKFPAKFQQYIQSFGDPRVFVTSLDTTTARIYPISVWNENQEFFEQFTANPEAAEDVAFIANDLGADAELDTQGRVLLPQELRQLLSIENQPVWLHCYKGRILLYSKEVYEQRKAKAREGLAEKLRELEKGGLR
ncbi:MAG: hypothetical protein ABFD60_16450 [Bryobacteraceae bacterium]